MAGTLNIVKMSNPYGDVPQPSTIVLDWTSDALGHMTVEICSTHIANGGSFEPKPAKLKGYIVGVETSPGENGDRLTDLPTDLYDLYLYDQHDVDVLGGTLENRSGMVAERVINTTPIPIDSEITVYISNMGALKQGRIILFIASK